MEEKIERLVKMMEDIQKIDSEERRNNINRRNDRRADNENKINANLTRISELQRSKANTETSNKKLEDMRAPFVEGEPDYIMLTEEIDTNNEEIRKIDEEISSLENENVELKKQNEEIVDIEPTDKPEKRAEMEQVKQEIIDELTQIQREVVSKRKSLENQAQSLENETAQMQDEIANRNEQVKSKELEIKQVEEADKKQLSNLKEENDKIAQKIELAKKYEQEKAKIDEEQSKLEADIEVAKFGIEIEKGVAERTGYTRKLEVQERWLKQKEDKFIDNKKSIEEMRKTLRLKSIDGIHRFIQTNERKFARNLEKIKNHKPSDRIEQLRSEISTMDSANKDTEKSIEQKSANARDIRSNIQDYSNKLHQIVIKINPLIEKVKGISTDFKYDTKIDINELQGIASELKEIKTDREYLEADRTYLEGKDGNLSQEEIDKIVSRTEKEVRKEEILAQERQAAKVKVEDGINPSPATNQTQEATQEDGTNPSPATNQTQQATQGNGTNPVRDIKTIDRIIIGNGIEIYVYDEDKKKYDITKVSFEKAAKLSRLNDREKMKLVNEITEKIMDDETRNILNEMDPSFIYVLNMCMKKNMVSKEQIINNLDNYISAIQGDNVAQEEMSTILEYNKVNKLFRGKVCDKINAFADRAKLLAMATVKEKSKKEKSGFLSKLFGNKKALESLPEEEPKRVVEAPSFAEQMANKEATARTNEVSARVREELETSGIEELQGSREEEKEERGL